jgi:hypothetical protein
MTTMAMRTSAGMAQDARSAAKSNGFKPSAPQHVTPPKPVIVPWQKKK